jgi:hypothetical protein
MHIAAGRCFRCGGSGHDPLLVAEVLQISKDRCATHEAVRYELAKARVVKVKAQREAMAAAEAQAGAELGCGTDPTDFLQILALCERSVEIFQASGEEIIPDEVIEADAEIIRKREATFTR